MEIDTTKRFVDIRLIGTAEQLSEIVTFIGLNFDIIDCSKLYPCRNTSELFRQYLKVYDERREKNK